jgi:hypothetical protein
MTYQHKVIFWIRDGFGYGFGVSTYIPVPYPCFEIGKNPNPYPNPVKTEKIRQIEFDSGG